MYDQITIFGANTKLHGYRDWRALILGCLFLVPSELEERRAKNFKELKTVMVSREGNLMEVELKKDSARDVKQK